MPNLLQIKVLVVGGSIAGLTCAIALRRAGHSVTLVEKHDLETTKPGGVRLPPNASRTLFGWGLEEQLRKASVTSSALCLFAYGSGDSLGSYFGSEPILEEIFGALLHILYSDLKRILWGEAESLGVLFQTQAEVVALDGSHGTVTLASGEILHGDIIVGADGIGGAVREHVLAQNLVAEPLEEADTGINVYSTTVASEKIVDDPEFRTLVDGSVYPKASSYLWCGMGVSAWLLPNGDNRDFTFYLLTNENTKPSLPPTISVGKAEHRIQKLAKLANPTNSVPIKTYKKLDSWTDPTRKITLIGSSSHPVSLGGFQSCAMSIEDGAALGKIFSHITSRTQIPDFTKALQDIRQDHRASVQLNELVFQQRTMQVAAGRMIPQWQDVVNGFDDQQDKPEMRRDGTKEAWVVEFAYDAEDAADNWWFQWGRMREHACRTSDPKPELLEPVIEDQAVALEIEVHRVHMLNEEFTHQDFDLPESDKNAPPSTS